MINTQDSQIVKTEKEDKYKEKYLKYKLKYDNLKKIFLQKGGVDYPWPHPRRSNLLYIALVISPNSDAGIEIDARTQLTIGQSAFGNQGGNYPLRSPHLSLLQINVPVDVVGSRAIQPLDNYITNNIGTVLNMIELSFRLNFINTYIHSPRWIGYNQLGPFIARVYDDNAAGLYDNIRQLQTTFRTAIESFLLLQLGPPAQINILQNLPPSWSDPVNPPTHVSPLHTHYSGYGNTFPNSAMSINFYSTTRWEPHISLFRIPPTRIAADLIQNFQQNDQGGNMSYINLWRQGTTSNGHDGSLSHIFVSYNGVNHWIPL